MRDDEESGIYGPFLLKALPLGVGDKYGVAIQFEGREPAFMSLQGNVLTFDTESEALEYIAERVSTVGDNL